MTCSGCSNQVQRVLGKLGDKVSNVQIDLSSKQVQIESDDLSSEELLEILKKTGKEVKLI
ncbi:HMA domain-containing protein [Meloidogyne graminicola]|uniref:Copper transport protein ATOX1 n=1 Tax=Meloidogyne graminicola TaxID=189291 RepID=A0A8S9ZIH7_9BILA|nr:HMA domain-containing protein [Meloidogyne graminicola]